MADVQRTGRIGGNELDLDFVCPAGVAKAIVGAERQDMRHDRAPGALRV